MSDTFPRKGTNHDVKKRKGFYKLNTLCSSCLHNVSSKGYAVMHTTVLRCNAHNVNPTLAVARAQQHGNTFPEYTSSLGDTQTKNTEM